jgi:hypothetical protein
MTRTSRWWTSGTRPSRSQATCRRSTSSTSTWGTPSPRSGAHHLYMDMAVYGTCLCLLITLNARDLPPLYLLDLDLGDIFAEKRCAPPVMSTWWCAAPVGSRARLAAMPGLAGF